ncbi:MAG: glycosyltransferase [Phycisphaerae bacterium]|nr:glycosyltransferase [Phycisphaerae bacterium]
MSHEPPTDAAASPFVSVVIPAYAAADDLPGCLEALETQTYPADRFEVIVVDNGGNEDVDELVRHHPSVTLLREERPSSYIARNRAVAVARGEVIAFTDADCRPKPGWIEAGVRALRSDDNAGYVGGRIELFCRDPECPTLAEHYEMATAFRQKESVRGGYAATANVFTSRRVLDQVGGFDESLKSLGDAVWTRSVVRAGYRPVYGHEAVVSHPCRLTLAQVRGRAVRKTGGEHDLTRRRRHPVMHQLAGLVRTFVPLQRVRLILGYHADRGAWVRPRLLLLQGSITLIEMRERLRLLLGGRSSRA